MNLKLLKNQAEKELKEAKNLKELDEVFRTYLGKRGKVTRILRSLEKISKAKRARIGKEANELKNFLERKFNEKAEEIKEKVRKSAEGAERLDITIPGKKPILGHLHPLTQVKREIEEIFQGMGFSIIEGPEVETEWYNFDALNIPKEHPARDMWDTLWLKGNDRLLLRTHTSPVQIRYLEKNQPPLRIIAPGRVFRHEATDASHEIDFWQVEGLMVDKEISVTHFKGIISAFLEKFFRKEIKTRLRPSYFPFTEPSFELDLQCIICEGRGCSVCKNTGWIEVIPGGMVHPNVFKNSGLDLKEWQGFAFGMGMNRLAMLKYKINDTRLFYSGDLRFLGQF